MKKPELVIRAILVSLCGVAIGMQVGCANLGGAGYHGAIYDALHALDATDPEWPESGGTSPEVFE